MTTSTLISSALDYILAGAPDVIGDPVLVIEGPCTLEEMTDEMVVFGDAGIKQTGMAFAGEGGAMVRDEESTLTAIVYCRREGTGPDSDPIGDARRRAVEILDRLDNFLRNDRTLGGLVMFAWARPTAMHKTQVAEGGREVYLRADIDLEGQI